MDEKAEKKGAQKGDQGVNQEPMKKEIPEITWKAKRVEVFRNGRGGYVAKYFGTAIRLEMDKKETHNDGYLVVLFARRN